MTKQLSDNGVQFTGAWEKFSPTPYYATPAERKRGIQTIGKGHVIKSGERFTSISEREADVLLRQDMSDAINRVNAVAHMSLNQAQFDAMCDLVFNVGPNCIKAGSGTGEALRRGDIATLRQKLPQFRNQTQADGTLKPELGIYRRAVGRLALFDGKPWQEAEAIGRAVKTL